MRILHTSDWHLGVDYGLQPRAIEQRRFLEWLIEVADSRAIDAIVIAGDVFDTSNPPAEAQALYYWFLAEVARRGRRAIVVGGNHDSPSRLDAPREVLAALSVEVVGGYDAGREGRGDAEPGGVLIPLRAGSGASGGPASSEVGLVVAAVPYLHEWKLGVRGFEVDDATQALDLEARFKEVYQRLADKAGVMWPGVPLMATGHLTCLPKRGEKPSEIDAIPREINRVGSLGALPPEVFDERHRYVALGHIHRSFAVDAGRRVWYSGTPIQVGAAESADGRRVLVVEVDERGGCTVEALAVPVTRRIVRLSGPFEEVRAKLGALSWPEAELPPYVSVEAVLDRVELGAQEALRGALREGPGGKPSLVEVNLPIRRARADGELAGLAERGGGLEALTPEAAFELAWRMRYAGAPIAEEVRRRFASLLSDAVAE